MFTPAYKISRRFSVNPESMGSPEMCVFIGQCESELSEGVHQRTPVFRRAVHQQVGVLRRVWEPEQDGPLFTNEQIPYAVAFKLVSNFLCLSILKRSHNPAIPAHGFRTSNGSLPWCRKPDRVHHLTLA